VENFFRFVWEAYRDPASREFVSWIANVVIALASIGSLGAGALIAWKAGVRGKRAACWTARKIGGAVRIVSLAARHSDVVRQVAAAQRTHTRGGFPIKSDVESVECTHDESVECTHDRIAGAACGTCAADERPPTRGGSGRSPAPPANHVAGVG
jgi:hypothetical protein